MPEYSYELKIPKERVAVLIGTAGKIKKEIEDNIDIKLEVDSMEGDVFIRGENALDLYTAREVVMAIGRGFNPEIAQLLLKGDYVFETISLSGYSKIKTHLKRYKGRVIGSEGKTRKLIEELTETHLSIYGKTISMIGESENVMVARKAIEQLLKGSMHSSVYRWLERKRFELKRKKILGKFEPGQI
jgi:ribosomal RNA assembly protein